MRILYFTDTYFPQINGVTNTLDKLVKYLDKTDHKYLFFAPYYENSPGNVKERYTRRFRSISFPAYPECRISIPFYSKLCRIADKFKPDVIHLMTPMVLGFTGLKYAQERGIPVVCSYTTNFNTYLRYYKLDFLSNIIWSYFKWFHNSCGITFCPSRDAVRILRSKEISNLKIMSRGIDTEAFNPEHRSAEIRTELGGGGKTTFLYVGRIAREKDLDILLESINQVNGIFPGRAQFVIAGDGPYTAQLKKAAPENVVFTGYIKGEALCALYASCDVFVFPSSTETFGNVVLEAMASGLPVLAVNSGGVKDSIIDGYNGFLCEPRDVEGFTRLISKLLRNTELIRRMGVNARQYTLSKAWNSIFDRLINDYQTLMARFSANRQLPHKAS